MELLLSSKSLVHYYNPLEKPQCNTLDTFPYDLAAALPDAAEAVPSAPPPSYAAYSKDKLEQQIMLSHETALNIAK